MDGCEEIEIATLELTADELVSAVLARPASTPAAILDSCGVDHLDSRFLLAGVGEPQVVEFGSMMNADETLERLAYCLTGERPTFFTLSYDLGLELANIESRHSKTGEPNVFAVSFPAVAVYDYGADKCVVIGCDARRIADEIQARRRPMDFGPRTRAARANSSFSRDEYIAAVDAIRELIRSGETYQTNLTNRFEAKLAEGVKAGHIFARLRRDNPVPFAAFIDRVEAQVVSASPERFFRIRDGRISVSPIKGTRPRGATAETDAAMRRDLVASAKDRAENTMIVDLVRNDLGRVCRFGEVEVAALCELEEHPTLFHLVSTVTGELREDASVADVIRALFPCGSITGAPKINTMRVIDRLERSRRGLSMGAIGYAIPQAFEDASGIEIGGIDTSVAIRTIVIRDSAASFNTGGGIVIDSRPESEYDEMLLKARALFNALDLEPFAAGGV